MLIGVYEETWRGPSGGTPCRRPNVPSAPPTDTPPPERWRKKWLGSSTILISSANTTTGGDTIGIPHNSIGM